MKVQPILGTPRRGIPNVPRVEVGKLVRTAGPAVRGLWSTYVRGMSFGKTGVVRCLLYPGAHCLQPVYQPANPYCKFRNYPHVRAPASSHIHPNPSVASSHSLTHAAFFATNHRRFYRIQFFTIVISVALLSATRDWSGS